MQFTKNKIDLYRVKGSNLLIDLHSIDRVFDMWESTIHNPSKYLFGVSINGSENYFYFDIRKEAEIEYKRLMDILGQREYINETK